MDYSDINLTPQLNSVNKLGENSEYVPASDFVTNNERGAITRAFMGSASIGNVQLGTAVIGTAQIGTISFNEISGGTAILGGTTNGNGVLSVRNQSGSQVVRLDSSGVTINNGSITIQDVNGSNVIDSRGIVSTTAFPFQVSYLSPNGTTTANYANGELGTVPNGTISLSRPRSISYLIGANVTYYQSNAITNPLEGVYFQFTLGGTGNSVGPVFGNTQHAHSGVGTGNPNGTSLSTSTYRESMSFVYTATTGTSNLVLNYAVNDRTSGTAVVFGTASSISSQIFAIQLGV